MSRTTTRQPSVRQLSPMTRAAALLCASLALPCTTALAGTTQIDNEPLATRPSVKAKPNLMVILDDSGSMDWDWMPDDLGYASRYSTGYKANYAPYSNWYGYWSSQCNGVAYDPAETYEPPSKYNDKAGAPVRYDNASYPNAAKDGYAGGTTADLSGHYYYTYSGSQPKMAWRYTTAGVVNNTFAQECRSDIGSTPGSNVFTRVDVSSLTPAQQTNYANWYSFYRKRYLLMRTAMGQALTALDDGYRVGFSTIREPSYTNGGTYKFLGVSEFAGGTDGQADKFYQSLYQVQPSGGTPLRRALSNTGRYYANKHSGQTDPVQYACQRNYALLTTDGYWNGDNGEQLDETAIGQQDAFEERPMRDDSVLFTQTQTVYTSPATRTLTETYNRRRSVTYTRTKTSSGKTYTQTNTCRQTGYEATPIYQQGVATYTKIEASGQPTTYSNISYDSWENTSTGATVYTENSVPSATSGTCSSSYSPSKPSGSTGWSAWSSASFGSWQTTTSDGTEVTDLLPSSTSAVSFTSSSPVSGTVVQAGTGASDTLADVAQYYWATDLRSSALGNCTSSASGTSRDVCSDIVPTLDRDPAKHQHMNTFTIGMGLSGTLLYDKNYLTQTSGDYVDLKNGTRNWPQPGDGEGAVNIDDLWHAAVNGRGQYYSAMDAGSLKDAIKGVLDSLDKTDGASSSAATSSIELVAGGDNRVFRAGYTTGTWTGDVIAYPLDGATAAISTTVDWSAQARLDGMDIADRKVYFNLQGTLTEFSYSNMDSSQKAHFDNLCSKPVVASQCASLSETSLAYANNGTNLVDYLRGVRTHESATTISGTSVAALYRRREHLLGDIINGAPVYVGKPPFSYADTGYNNFKTSTTRGATIYVGANDGMLHAIDAETGDERWAFIPTAVMPNLYKLADSQYSTRHQYFVDGAPVIGDIQVDGNWKTIIVGGLNKGGKSYYALDITDPESPQLLWEFTHDNLGLSYGNPVITKNKDGTWVVAFSSGYNNETGDGLGRLFVVNANTGVATITNGIPTTAGSKATPSGLAKINAWVDDEADNTAKRFYGGDNEGNVWRFDPDTPTEAHLLGTAMVNGTTPQPITTKPVLLQADGKAVVIVGTGRYLGENDITDSTQQSIYAIKDPLDDASWGDIRENDKFVQHTLTVSGTTASISATTVNWSTNAGWWVDLPNANERISTSMSAQFTTLVIPTAIPSGNACTSGGSSWLYYLNALTGGVINDQTPAGTQFSDKTLLVGTSWVRDSNGNTRLIVQGSDGTLVTRTPPVNAGGSGGTVRRTSWRELVD